MTRGHSDKQYRDSLVYDLMELYHPAVDALVLTFLDRTTFAYGDMVRASTGQCMLHPRLARAVVAACRVEQERVSKGADCLAASWAVLIGVGRGRLLIRALHRASSNSR